MSSLHLDTIMVIGFLNRVDPQKFYLSSYYLILHYFSVLNTQEAELIENRNRLVELKPFVSLNFLYLPLN